MIYVSLFIVFFFGVFAGRQGLYGSPEPPPVQGVRCTNGPNPKTWTRGDAEAALLYAQASLDTARMYSGSPQHKSAFALESIAASLIVRECWK